MILAIDPGNEYSAYAILDKELRPQGFNKITNDELFTMLEATADCEWPGIDHLAIEMVACYGMPVGKEVFETCVVIGRIAQIAKNLHIQYIYRKDEKMNLCGSMRAKDANIRQALIDRFAKHDLKNGKGTKKAPDWFYGFHADVWAAYAVGVTFHDMYEVH